MATGPKLRSVNSLIGAEALCEMSFKPSKPGRTRGADGGQSSRSVKQKVETHGEARNVAGLARGGTVDLNQFDHASLREHGQLGAAREQLEAQLASGRLGKGTPGVHMRCAPCSLCCEGSTGLARAQYSRLTLLDFRPEASEVAVRLGRSANAAPASHSEQPGNAETRHQPDDDGEERPLPWGAVPTLLSTDTYGVPIFSPSQMPVVQLQVNLQRLAPTLSHTP